MAEIRHLENRHNVIFFCRGWSRLDKISQTGAEWHVDCGDVVKIETRCRIPIWRTFERIPWHVIPEPHATLQGTITWRNQCHDRATLQGVIILSAILKIVFCLILFIVCFLMQLWRAAAFVSSPIHLYRYRQVLWVCQYSSARWRSGGAGPGTGFTPHFCISVRYLKKLWTDFDEILCVKYY